MACRVATAPHTPHTRGQYASAHKPGQAWTAAGGARPLVASALVLVPSTRRAMVAAQATNPVRQALSSLVSGVYKASAVLQPPEPGLSPLWAAIKRLDVEAVRQAAAAGGPGATDERDATGDTPLLYIARQGHYKYPPAEIPKALITAGADVEAKDAQGLTALQVALLSGWQNIAELLLTSGADTSGVPAIKARLTCPDCKALVAQYRL